MGYNTQTIKLEVFTETFFSLTSFELLTAEWSLAPGIVDSELSNLRKMTLSLKNKNVLPHPEYF